MYDEYGDNLGFIVPFNLTIVPKEECDYEQMSDGSFKYEHRRYDEVEVELKPNLIKNWTIEMWSGSAVVIRGDIYNDTKGRFADGTPIHTSSVKSVDFVKKVAQTRNSTYNLE